MSSPLDVLSPAERARTVPAGEPGWRAPMLATLTQQVFSSDRWVFERKLDGVRAVATVDGRSVALWSRNHKPMRDSYPELVSALAGQARAPLVADGEIVAFDGNRTSFARLQQRLQLTDARRIKRTGVAVYYYLFDLLECDGTDLARLPLRARKRVLRRAIGFGDPLRLNAHRNADGERFYEQACARGWEGLIAKRADAPYRGGRSPDWLKLKCVAGQEFVIGGFTEPRGGRYGFGALLVGYYDGGRLRYAGKVGTGYGEQMLRSLRSRMDDLRLERSPFAERVAERDVHWIRPELVAQVGFSEWTGDGRLRHPRFQGLRDDKPAREVVREAA